MSDADSKYTDGPVSDGGMDPRNAPAAAVHDEPPTIRGWRFERRDGDGIFSRFISIRGPVPTAPGESPRTSEAVYEATQRDLYDLLGRIADAQAKGGDDSTPVPVCTVSRVHLRDAIKASAEGRPWCREALLYSADNPHDRPEGRVMLYTAGRLDDRLDYVERTLVERSAQAQASARQAEAARATARLAIGYLQAALDDNATPEKRQQARNNALDWLVSIGAETGA